MRASLPIAALCSMVAGACSSGKDFTVSGRVAPPGVRLQALGAATPVARTITHVMAVDPESAVAERSIAAVGADGKFSLEVQSGRPYVLVFIDSTAVGAHMVVAIFRARTLDTLAPMHA